MRPVRLPITLAEILVQTKIKYRVQKADGSYHNQ